ncbi:MAG: hypothetical protein AB1646_21820 [Thermodesulfobacteriota bacterium]
MGTLGAWRLPLITAWCLFHEWEALHLHASLWPSSAKLVLD